MKSRAKTLICKILAVAAAAMAASAVGQAARAVETVAPHPAVAQVLPIASDARIAGDEKQTRFILDLDRKIDVRAFVLSDPYRLVVDIPQTTFNLPAGSGTSGRGLIRSFRYGMVMPGASRVVIDLTGPSKVDKSYVLDGANDQPPRLIVELSAVDRAAFKAALVQQASVQQVQDKPSQDKPAQDKQTQDKQAGDKDALLRPAILADAASDNTGTTPAKAPDTRPVIVLDPGHGGIDNGTVAESGENEKDIVLDFAKALRDRIEKSGKYRVVMTRSDDTFVPLGDRVKIARNQTAALFVSIHADSLPKSEGDAQGATIYTLSDKASDAEAAALAESENKADAIAGINLTEEPTDVADILIDLTQRETRAFSNRFAKTLFNEMKSVARMHKNPLKSAGFKVLKAHDVPSVLIELGYVSNKDDLQHLVSEGWRSKTVGSVNTAVDAFFGKRVVSAGASN